MAFKNIKIVGDDTAQAVITNTETLEGVTHGVIAYNSTEGALSFDILIEGDVRLTEEVPANGSYRLPDKINVPVNEALSINAPTGVNVTVSSYQSAIDPTAANTAVQQAVIDTADNVALTNADVITTQADVVSTNADVVTAQEIIDNISVAPLWASGSDYVAYQVVTDTIDYKTYKAKIDITNSTTEPSTDPDWVDISSGGTDTFTEIQTAVGGETEITVPTYIVGANQLVVAIEGNVQHLDTDYTETNATTITLTTALTEDEKILIQKV